MILEHGRPENISIRCETEKAVYDFLDALNIEYLRIDHAPAMTMEICAEIDKTLNAQICKNLFLCNRRQTDFYLLLIPADKKFKTKDLSAQINSSRLSFSDGEHMENFICCTPGSASVLGLIFDKDNHVKLLIDKEVLDSEYIGCHPCINTSSLKIKTADMLQQIIPATNHSFCTVDLPRAEQS